MSIKSILILKRFCISRSTSPLNNSRSRPFLAGQKCRKFSLSSGLFWSWTVFCFAYSEICLSERKREKELFFALLIRYSLLDSLPPPPPPLFLSLLYGFILCCLFFVIPSFVFLSNKFPFSSIEKKVKMYRSNSMDQRV